MPEKKSSKGSKGSKGSDPVKKGAKKIVSKLNPFKVSLKYLTWVFFILLGGFLFNLDRMGDFGLELLKHKELIPYRLRAFLPGGTAIESNAAKYEVITGRAIEVYDGDTITLLCNDKKYRVRFYGIDAPEARQEHGIAARDALRKKILGREVTVNVVNLDRYGRAVGKVSLDSRNINLEMVREGHAWYYEAYARGEDEIERAHVRARREKRGLWKYDSPTPPWKYRAAKE